MRAAFGSVLSKLHVYFDIPNLDGAHFYATFDTVEPIIYCLFTISRI